jgi:2-octaprenyl-6-methoxyphenol hydroxylase
MVARNNKSYDIVIAGGGMIGSSLALALAPVGLRVAMVEPVPRANEAQPSFDDRSTALSRSTQRMFAAMDIWDPVAAAATPIKSVHVSDRGRFGFAHIDAKEQGVDALGHVVINRVLGQVLQDRINDVDGLDILCPARIVAVSCETDGAVVTVDRDGERTELESRLVVAADGANSTVRDLSGIGAIRVPYEQRAIIGNLLTELPLKNRAFERFTRQGPLAILPLPDGRAGFVRVVSESDADGILALDDASFAGDLQRAFGYRLGELSRVGKRASYPLSLTRALRLTGTRVAGVQSGASRCRGTGRLCGRCEMDGWHCVRCRRSGDARTLLGLAQVGPVETCPVY